MVAVNMAEVHKLVARCRRIGWPVEQGTGRQPWMFRITLPTGAPPVQIHRTPSDRRWLTWVKRDLDAAGFTEAENAWIAANDENRRAAIEEDRARADAQAAKLAAQSAAVVKAAGDYGIAPVDVEWLLTPTRIPQSRFVLIDPETAAKVLDTVNTGNRKYRPARAAFFATVIEAGEWAATHHGAAFDWNGICQDGQHRFGGIVITGRTVPMQVTVGMDPDNFRKVDSPLLRTARDAAGMRGEVNVTALTGAARLIANVRRHNGDAHLYGRKMATSIDTIDRTIIDCGDRLRTAIVRANHIRRELKTTHAGLSAAIFLIGENLPPDDPRVAEFCEQLESGVGIDKSHPVWKLRRKILLGHISAHSGGSATWEFLAHVIKAWNHVAADRTPTDLVWRSNEPFPAAFVPPPIGDAPPKRRRSKAKTTT